MDELLKEVRTLCKYLTSEQVIEFDYNNNGPDEWKCPFCLAGVPVKYIRPTTYPGPFNLPRTEPCNLITFPHGSGCEVLRARRILDLLDSK